MPPKQKLAVTPESVVVETAAIGIAAIAVVVVVG